MLRYLSLTLSVCLLAACNKPAPNPPTKAAPPVASNAASTPQSKQTVATRDGHFSPDIRAEDFAGYDQRLSSDAFEGRKPGTIGERMTTTYLIDQFQSMGLKPGNHGSFLQSVPAIETTQLNGDKVVVAVKAGGKIENYANQTDVMIGTLQGKPHVQISDSNLVFVGYGIVAPEYHWNDYAGLDVKGKTVVVLVNDPGSAQASLFKGRNMTYYGRWTYKFEEAARQGAVGCLVVHDTDKAGYPWHVVRNSWSGPQFSLPPSEDPAPRLNMAGWISADATEKLFAATGANFAALKSAAAVTGFKAVPLSATLTTQFDSRIRNVLSTNVVAMLPGSQRPDEAIIYSAHWDHFGRDEKLQGDQIFNGAVDNGTGLAALLELADAFAHQQPAPQRSVMFLVTTLEEAGLLGSQYYSLHPVIPLNKTVADINMDILMPIGRTHDMAIIGFGQSQMDAYLKTALLAQNRVIVADEEPEKGMFYRSDQLNFARQGVPVLYARGGFDKLAGGKPAGRAAYDDYTKNRYHKPADNYDANWDFSGVIEDVNALYAVGKRLADESTFPDWALDSEFRAARIASMKAATKP